MKYTDSPRKSLEKCFSGVPFYKLLFIQNQLNIFFVGKDSISRIRIQLSSGSVSGVHKKNWKRQCTGWTLTYWFYFLISWRWWHYTALHFLSADPFPLLPSKIGKVVFNILTRKRSTTSLKAKLFFLFCEMLRSDISDNSLFKQILQMHFFACICIKFHRFVMIGFLP